MHIPDGFLDAHTSLITAALSTTGLAFALRHTRKTLAPHKVPLLGLAAAFVFAAQMLNFPVAGGTSGHLIGGVLVAALLGPSAAVIVLATVLIVQCLTFADGGITALGANIFNMGILGGAVGGIIYAALTGAADKFATRPRTRIAARLAAAAVTSWIVVVLASIAAAGELASSGTVPWNIAFPAMAGTHALIGIGEGLITVLVLSAIAATRPDLILGRGIGVPPMFPGTLADPTSNPLKSSLKPILVFGLLATLGLALFISPFASQLPDGLDFVAKKIGFSTQEKSHASIFSGYTPIAASIAVVLLFFSLWLTFRLITRSRIQPEAN